MKKQLFFLFLLGILTISLYGCTTEKSDLDILNEFADAFVIDETLSTTCLDDQGREFTLEIISDNQNVISDEGKFYYTLEEELVNLDITFFYNGLSVNKQFEYISEANPEKVFEEAFNLLNIPTETNTDLTLATRIKYGKYSMVASYTSNTSDVLSNSGVITLSNTDKTAELKVKLKYTSYQEEKTFEIKVLKLELRDFQNAVKGLISSNEIKDNLTLPAAVTISGKEIDITWSSSNKDVLSDDGKINVSTEDANVILTVNSNIGYSYNFSLKIIAQDAQGIVEKALKELSIPAKLSTSIILPTELLYGVTCTWSSSNPSIITNDGKYVGTNTTYQKITLTATLKKGTYTMTEEFNIVCAHEEHMFIDRTFEGTKTSTHIENSKLVLDSNALEGTYETAVIETNDFTECVASFAAITSKTATCEIMVSLRVNGTWSKYFSYGAWGLGLQNKTSDSKDSIVKMVADEIKTIDKAADAFKLKIVLKRTSLNVESPIVSLIALALHFSSYSYPVNISSLPNEVKYDIYNLHQNDVPVIGNSICSATTTTMLLNYKGHSFEGLAAYQHEYMAYIVKDYGADIFGNWSYNTIAMGAYGEDAYVKRFYSLEELMYHLATVGPVGASVKGQVINNVRNYNTAGHLLVVSGYKIENGAVTFYIKDPNVNSQNVVMTSQNFENIYRFVSYIVE